MSEEPHRMTHQRAGWIWVAVAAAFIAVEVAVYYRWPAGFWMVRGGHWIAFVASAFHFGAAHSQRRGRP